MMKLSKAGADLIKKYEGCRLTAYLCPANVWTIGWGHTGNVKKCQTITQVQADALFDKDIQRYVDGVNDVVKVELNQNQFDALVSFAYNCGVDALRKSTLLKYVNGEEFSKASAEFDRWNKGNGKVLAGLVRRRFEEKELFNTSGTTDKKTSMSDKSYVVITDPIADKNTADKFANGTRKAYSIIVHVLIKPHIHLKTGSFKDKRKAQDIAKGIKRVYGVNAKLIEQ
jgi:lysozyme